MQPAAITYGNHTLTWRAHCAAKGREMSRIGSVNTAYTVCVRGRGRGSLPVALALAALTVVGWSFLLPVSTAGAQSSPVPLINEPLVPDAAAPGGQGFTLTANGTGFASGAVVNWSKAV